MQIFITYVRAKIAHSANINRRIFERLRPTQLNKRKYTLRLFILQVLYTAITLIKYFHALFFLHSNLNLIDVIFFIICETIAL